MSDWAKQAHLVSRLNKHGSCTLVALGWTPCTGGPKPRCRNPDTALWVLHGGCFLGSVVLPLCLSVYSLPSETSIALQLVGWALYTSDRMQVALVTGVQNLGLEGEIVSYSSTVTYCADLSRRMVPHELHCSLQPSCLHCVPGPGTTLCERSVEERGWWGRRAPSAVLWCTASKGAYWKTTWKKWTWQKWCGGGGNCHPLPEEAASPRGSI